MYDPSTVNDAATWIIFLGAIPACLFVLLYGFLAPWYRSLLGFTLFGLMASIAAILVFVVLRRIFGAFPGYEWWAVGVYSIFGIFITALSVIFVVERRRAGLLVFLIRRRDIGKEKQ